MDYKSAGVDVDAGYKAVELMKGHIKKTFRSEVLSDIGGFGGLFSITKAKEMQEPVLVSGTDGVGTKLKIAFLMDKHDTIGIDAVAMCVNDIVCSGAEPLFFLDYIACGKNVPERIAQIVKGISEGCQMAGCALIGGETAEMPGFYPEDEYDVAGFSVGILDKVKAVDSSKIKKGDAIIGIASSGIHSNGYSLVRKVFEPSEDNVDDFYEELGMTLGQALLTPTKIYVKTIQNLMNKIHIKGISNITGGGFIENIPRMMPEGTKAVINEGAWPILPIFELMEKKGQIKRLDMYNTFNMGIGMTLVVEDSEKENCVKILEELGEQAYIIGTVDNGGGIEICLE